MKDSPTSNKKVCSSEFGYAVKGTDKCNICGHPVADHPAPTTALSSKQVLDKKQVAASNVPFKAQNLGRDPEAQGPSPLDLLQAEIERLRAALDKIRRESAAQVNGSTHYEGCAVHHPHCRILAFVQDALRPCPPFAPIERPADETPAVQVRKPPRPAGSSRDPDDVMRCKFCDAQVIGDETISRARECCYQGRNFDVQRGKPIRPPSKTSAGRCKHCGLSQESCTVWLARYNASGACCPECDHT